jgi:putative zinc finger protein
MDGRTAVTHEEFAASFTPEKYMLGELSDAERDRFEEHYFECAECAEAIRSLSQFRAGAKLIEQEQPAREDSKNNTVSWWQGWWRRPQLGVAGALAAVAFAAVLGYQNAQLRTQLQPQTVESLVLRPTTRGEAQTLPSRQVGPFVLLEADLPSASGRLTWNVRSENGKAVLEGAGPAPQPGSSWKLLVPAAQIPDGHHMLTVRSNSGDEWLFRFQTGPR